MEQIFELVRLVDEIVEHFQAWKLANQTMIDRSLAGRDCEQAVSQIASDSREKLRGFQQSIFSRAVEDLPEILEAGGEDSKLLLAFVKDMEGRSGFPDTRIVEEWRTLRADLERFVIRQGLPEIPKAPADKTMSDLLKNSVRVDP